MVRNLKTLTRERVACTVAMFGLGLCSTTVVHWTLFYYAPPVELGAKVYLGGAAAVGAAMALGRLVDAWSDPLVGYFSDRTRLRFGRRRPFMAAAIPLFAASFILLWFSPAPSTSLANLLWVAGFLGLFFVSFSVYAVPYLALLPELTEHHPERVFLVLVQSVQKLVFLWILWVLPVVILITPKGGAGACFTSLSIGLYLNGFSVRLIIF